jgi:glutaconate CoA-transferase subunit B
MNSMNYTREELMAVLISREIRDGERVGVGTLSPVVAAGCILAQNMHAARASFAIWGFCEYWPFTEGMRELFDCAQRGRIDLFFLSGAQIDKSGNINLTAVGDYNLPKVRLPGGAGTATLSYTVPRIILFQLNHSKRIFVDKVNFVTATNDPPPNVFRRGRYFKCVTPLATFNLEPGGMSLEKLNPGATLEEVVENTGFALTIPRDIKIASPPADEELKLLRTIVKRKMVSVYPQFCAASFRNNSA